MVKTRLNPRYITEHKQRVNPLNFYNRGLQYSVLDGNVLIIFYLNVFKDLCKFDISFILHRHQQRSYYRLKNLVNSLSLAAGFQTDILLSLKMVHLHVNMSEIRLLHVYIYIYILFWVDILSKYSERHIAVVIFPVDTLSSPAVVCPIRYLSVF